MRVVAGTHRGRRLRAPRGADTRPTADRVREAVFSILGPIDGLRVLDLFAGSGAMGVEALSRGAAHATFVDRDPQAIACVRANLEALGLADRAEVIKRDWRSAVRGLAASQRFCGLCVMDPPYTVLPSIVREATDAMVELMPDGGFVVIEGPAAGEPPLVTEEHVESRIDRTYGGTRITILGVRGAAR